MCSTKICINFVLVFLAVFQTSGVAFNLTTELRSNVESTIFSNLTVISDAYSTGNERTRNGVQVADQPPRFIIGNSVSSTIESCLFDNPENCTILVEGEGVSINAISIASEHIYAGLDSGAMWRCLMREKDSCVEISRTSSAFKSIAVAFEFVYTGLEDGTLRRCRIDKEDSCVEFKKAGVSVNAIVVQDHDCVYAGWGSRIMKCSQKHHKMSCTPYYHKKVPITALATFAGDFIFVGLQSGALLRCSLQHKTRPCLLVASADSGIYSLYVFNGHLYAGLDSGAMLRCSMGEAGTCEQISTKKPGRFSFAITYGTEPIYPRVEGEHEGCPWQNVRFWCPPYVIYYDYKERAAFELNIKNGEVFHSSGERFDTTEADEVERAIYVMDSVGRIYASNRYPFYLVHHSSFLAGQPVAAAGEIEVVRGVIKSINNYSGHYRLPLDVNNQILDTLKIRGYKKPIEVRMCDELALNSSLYFQTLGQPAVSRMPVVCNKVISTGTDSWSKV